LRNNNSAVIILQSDHGPGSELDWESKVNTNLAERFSILNAYYFQDGDYSSLDKSITPVNSFRILLDKYFETEYYKVKDRSYFSTYSQPYKFIDVTSEIENPQI